MYFVQLKILLGYYRPEGFVRDVRISLRLVGIRNDLCAAVL